MPNEECLMNVDIIKTINNALKEDVGPGDITTNSIVPNILVAKGKIIAKEAGVVAGLQVAKEVFQQVDQRIKFRPKIKDGTKVRKGKVLAEVAGPARGILTGERVALNFLQRLSGIATLTNLFTTKIKGLRSVVLDTRKTTPGLRVLEKYAVKCGGGTNHRFGLYDAILIKDNHIKLVGGIKKVVQTFRSADLRKPIEIEAKTLAQVKKAIAVGADRILLDNMSLKILRQAVKFCKTAKIKTEASGGVNLATIRAIAKTGVDFISVGALTHSAKALDISLDLV